MGIYKETQIVLDSTGRAEYKVDRVKTSSDDKVLRRMKVTRRTVPASSLAPNVGQPFALPLGCRIVRHIGSRYAIFVIENPPQTRTISWRVKNCTDWDFLWQQGARRKFGLTWENQHDDTFRVAFPYVIFVIKWDFYNCWYDSVRVYFRTEPLTSLSDYLCQPCLPNLSDGDNGVCMGSMAYGREESREPIDMIHQAIEHFWTSTFNGDWANNYETYQHQMPQLQTPWHWQYYSKKNPLWVLDANWIRSSYIIGDVIESDSHSIQLMTDHFFSTARSTETWDEVHAESVDGDSLVPSTSLSVMHSGVIYQIGDQLKPQTLTAKIMGLLADRQYTIEHFFNQRWSGERFVKLAGVDKPMPLTCLDLAQKSTRPTGVMFGPHRISAGAGLYLTHRDEMMELNYLHLYEITDLRVDDEGDISVRLLNRGDDWYYITHNGGEPLPSVRINLPKLRGDIFDLTCHGCLTTGQVIHVEFKNIPVAGIKRISGFRAETETDESGATIHTGNYYITFEGSDEEFLIFGDGVLQMEWSFVVYSVTDIDIRFGDNNLYFGRAYLICEDWGPIPAGSLIKPIRPVIPTEENWNSLDVDVEIEDIPEPVPFIVDGQQRFPKMFRAAHFWEAGHSGQKLIAPNAVSDLITKGEELEILCFTPHEDGFNQQAVFTDGRAIKLNSDGRKFISSEATQVMEEIVFAGDTVVASDQCPAEARELFEAGGNKAIAVSITEDGAEAILLFLMDQHYDLTTRLQHGDSYVSLPLSRCKKIPPASSAVTEFGARVYFDGSHFNGIGEEFWREKKWEGIIGTVVSHDDNDVVVMFDEFVDGWGAGSRHQAIPARCLRMASIQVTQLFERKPPTIATEPVTED